MPKKTYTLKLTQTKRMKIDTISRGAPMFLDIGNRNENDIYLYLDSGQDKKKTILKITPGLEITGQYSLPGGRGPGELLNPRCYGGENNSVLFYDIGQHKYSVYTAAFQFIREFKISGEAQFYDGGYRYFPAKQLILDGRNEMISAGKNRLEFMAKIRTRQLDGERLTNNKTVFQTNYNTKNDKGKHILGKPVDFGFFFEHIYILDKRQYRLIKMNLHGETLKRITVKFPQKTFSQSERKQWLSQSRKNARILNRITYPETLWPAMGLVPIGNGIAVTRCKNYDPSITGPISADYFDQDLKYLGEITIPYIPYWNHPTYGHLVINDRTHNCPASKTFFTIDESTNEEEEYFLVRWQTGQ